MPGQQDATSGGYLALQWLLAVGTYWLLCMSPTAGRRLAGTSAQVIKQPVCMCEFMSIHTLVGAFQQNNVSYYSSVKNAAAITAEHRFQAMQNYKFLACLCASMMHCLFLRGKISKCPRCPSWLVAFVAGLLTKRTRVQILYCHVKPVFALYTFPVHSAAWMSIWL